MKTLYEKSFGRDLKKVKDKRLLKQVQKIIAQVESANSLSDLQNVKKLEGYTTYYRIRVGEYRIGIEVVEGQVIFVCFLNRKDIYRYFP
ncbi:MAG TPA: type II toxin-antitoxin system RelE/ParE family toxin [Anaerolineales bacterium]|nr:type II toxin-antitoxin system RelE/ParE family toxin [Anaerolineae bacterium AMX1]WKZ53531.1 MAG: type II toxin-antitoxin system RelE/ParE family toxin [Anaerolineales bacterium]GIK10500.1 MAG: toxin RelE [Chloroflexota bacterium]GJQ37528.1 MAG: toxin RelE [Anaerolineaceae bacterium]HMN00338.1 type II toxin-antitoxin system RelE/ParE family toxin [Anaerolineales bacterium]